MHRTIAALTLSALAVVACVGPVFAAGPVTTGCPSGLDARTVDQWADLGYPGPRFIDANGNGDGVICGLAMPDGFVWGNLIRARGIVPSVDVIYRFRDNDLPANR